MNRWIKCLLALTLLIIGGGIGIYHHVKGTIRDSYAKWQVSEMVIEYKGVRGKMPESWNDLQDYFRDNEMRGYGFYEFHEVRQRIIIDFPLLPLLEKTYSSEEEIPPVIKALSGRKAHWDRREPNQHINRIILEHKSRPSVAQEAGDTREPDSGSRGSAIQYRADGDLKYSSKGTDKKGLK